MSTYAIGDVQGCLPALLKLLETIDFDPAVDTLWFAGDLVNRGPQSLETLRFIRDLGSAARCVLGNHDLHLLAGAAGFARQHKNDTLHTVLEAPDAPELIDWLRRQPLLYADERFPQFFMVHAGLLPGWSRAQALVLAGEVSQVLRSQHWPAFMAALYGNQPSAWDDALQGHDRLRVIINAMTRMRFCSTRGVMDLKIKDSADQLPDGFMPWFDVPGRRSADVRVIMGHWSTLGLVMRPDLLALDTGCVWGGCLSAVRLDDEHLFQTACDEALDPLAYTVKTLPARVQNVGDLFAPALETGIRLPRLR